MYFFVVVVVVFTLLITVSWSTTRESSTSYIDVMQTVSSSMKIPQKVNDNWNKFAPEVKRSIYNDEQCKSFLSTHFGDRFSTKFDYLENGAHKADLFRYAWLYIHGGVYMDIKTVLIKPFQELFPDPSVCYMVVSDTTITSVPRIYNGIIATPPKNPIMYKLMTGVMQMKNEDQYIKNCEDGFDIVSSMCVKGLDRYGYKETIKDVPSLYVFKETSKSVSECQYKADRYGMCTFITDKYTNILKVRYSDYPW